MVWGAGGRFGLLKVIQQLGQPRGVQQKEPPQHRLKSRGLAVDHRIPAAWSPAGPVAAPADQRLLRLAEQRQQLLQGPGLGSGPDLLHHSTVEMGGSGGLTTASEPLMQIPDRIADPGRRDEERPHRAPPAGALRRWA